MSYARFNNDSNVYVYHHYMGFIECCGCWISDEIPDEYGDIPSPRFYTARAILAHLDEHVAKGYLVEEYTINRIKAEYVDLDVPIEKFVETPEQIARAKARIDRLRQRWLEETVE